VAISTAERRERARLRAEKKRVRPGQLAKDAKARRDRNAQQRGKTNAYMRGYQNRQREQHEFFSRVRQALHVASVEGFARAGCSVVNALQLRRPLFVVEFNGRRTFEYWAGTEDTTEEEEMTEKTKPTEPQIVEALSVTICLEADKIEERAEKLAERTGCPAHVILDALTIELTGRFIGRIRDRDAATLKNQPSI
jgi:hypothetical protein